MSKSGTLKSIQPVTRIYGISERKKLNPILVEAKTKQGFLEWIKKTRRPCVYKRIESGEMSRKNLLKYLNQYEEYRTALEEKESLTKEIFRLEKAISAVKNRLSKSKVKNSDLEQKIKDLETKLEQVEGSD